MVAVSIYVSSSVPLLKKYFHLFFPTEYVYFFWKEDKFLQYSIDT
jgi:hypothetical protein